MIQRERRGPDGRVAVITLDRPERRNALDRAALDQLAEAVAELHGPDAPRVVVITGAHGHFCAGADLTTLDDPSYAGILREMLSGLRSLPLVTIAAVDGAALGAGTQLAVSCDLRVATPQALFGIPAARLGVMIDFATVQRLHELVGAATARAMLLGAQVVRGSDALRLGWVEREGSLHAALAWADELAELAPLSLAGHKLGLELLDPPMDPPAAYVEAFDRAWASQDLQEGRRAFTEKRPPRFTGT